MNHVRTRRFLTASLLSTVLVSTGSSQGTRVIVPKAKSVSQPSSLDARFVNDNANEVDSADILDGSLTGADVSTSSGDVTFADATLRASRAEFGQFNTTEIDAFATGFFNGASGFRSAVLGGQSSEAAGSGSVVIGRKNSGALGQGSSVIRGRFCAASGSESSVLGSEMSDATGARAVILGSFQSIASSTACAVVAGTSAEATGFNSIAMGFQAVASGLRSMAVGRATALHDHSFVWSGATTFDPNRVSSADGEFNLFAPGGVRMFGTDSTTVALTVAPGGNVGVGLSAADHPLQVDGGLDVSPGSGGYFVSGPTTGANIAMDDNEIMARDNGMTANLRLNRDGGDVWILGASGTGNVGIGNESASERLDVTGNVRCVSLIETSDERLKKDIQPVEDATAVGRGLRGVSFAWDQEQLPEAGDGRQVGLLAQDVQRVLPEAVRQNGEGTLGVAYSQVVPVLVEALKEQDERVAELSAENAALSSLLARMEERLAKLEEGAR